MNIIIKKHFLFYKGYKLKCSIGKSGLSHSKKEGDLTTPKGLFKLGLLYYRNDRIKLSKCVIKKRIIKKIWDGVTTAEVENTIKRFLFHLNMEPKNFTEKKKFMTFLLI